MLEVLDDRTPITDGIGTTGTDGCGSLQAQAQHRFAQNFQLSVIYTSVRVKMCNTANTSHHSNPTIDINSSSFMEAVRIANSGR